MKKNKYILAGLALTMGLSSCSDFLSHVPDDRTVIESVDAVKELLVSAYPETSYMVFCEAMSDNSEDKGPNAYGRAFTNNKNSYFWGEHVGTAQDTYSYFWTNSYNAIATVNHAIDAIEEQGSGPEFAPYYAEAFIARAYNHFMLVNVFAEHYDESKNASRLGVPYILKAEKEVFGKYDRETLEKTYQLIEEDLLKGVSRVDNSAYTVPSYHFNQDAAHTFASRFYLYRGEWEKVLEHTNEVLLGDVQKRLRPWNSEYINFSYANLETAYTKSDQAANLLITSAVTQVGRNYAYLSYGMGLNSFKELFGDVLSDVRDTRWSYDIYGNEVLYHIPKFKEHFKLNSINSTFGVGYVMCPLFTVEETLLNRIEANIMLNKFEDAEADINVFLSTRIRNYNPTVFVFNEERLPKFMKNAIQLELNPVYELSPKQEKYMQFVLNLRKREFIMEGLRWFDIKRFHLEVTRYAYQNPSVIEDVLTKDDLRRAVQIPQDAINYGIEPNPR